jgi:hypothetical protein
MEIVVAPRPAQFDLGVEVIVSRMLLISTDMTQKS